MATIRAFQPGDLEQCVDLYMRVFSAPPWEEEWEPADARGHLTDIVDAPGFSGLVALEDDQVVGVILGFHKRTSTGMAFLVDDMFVDNVHQRKHIGQLMMTALKQTLKDERVQAIGLMALEATPAAAFIRSQGFIDHPELRFLRFDLSEWDA